jgi:apolipoprotein N-acyltransferase
MQNQGQAPFLGGLGLAVLSGWGLYLALSFQKLGLLAWVALVPLVLAQFLLAPDDRSSRFYQAVTYTLGIGLTVLVAFPPDLVHSPIPLTVPVAVVVLLVGGLVYLVGLPTGLPSFHRRTGFSFFVIGPALTWVGFEFLRMHLQLGHIWGLLATSQQDYPSIWRLAALGGPWLPSFFIVAVNYALGLAGIALLSPRDRSARRPALFSMLALVPLVGGVFAWRAGHEPEAYAQVRVAAIQPGAELGDVYDYHWCWYKRDWEGLSREIIPDMASWTRLAATQGAELIVWPEATLWLDPRTDPWSKEQLLDLARETGAILAVPYFILTPEGNISWWLGFAPGMRNEVVLVTPQGELLDPYAKSHPISFIGERSSTRGLEPIHPLPWGQVGSMLGYDTAFTDTARRQAGRGAQLLTLSTHDWIQMSSSYGAHTCLRAVENGLAVIKADWEVGSLIVDPWGQILAAAPDDHETEAILVADVPLLPPGGTPYTHLGDWLGYGCLLGMVGFLTLARLRRFRQGRAPVNSESSAGRLEQAH